MITKSPSFNFSSLELCTRLCCSLKPLRYSSFQLNHTWSLQEHMYLALLFRSQSLVLSTSRSQKFGCPRNIKFGMRIGVWMSSSIWSSRLLLSVISIPNITLLSPSHVNSAFQIALNKACLVNPMILSNWLSHQGARLRLKCYLMWCFARKSWIFSSFFLFYFQIFLVFFVF